MDFASYQQVGAQPVSATAPQGADLRDDPRFEALQQALAALSSPHANARLDWGRVARLAADLLRDAGKDMLVGSYLAGALLQLGGLRGLAEGLGVLTDMVERYWSTMYPPLSRIRGRRNALQWLLDRVDLLAEEQHWDAFDPQPSELIALLHMQAERLEQALAHHDPEGPSLHGLLSWLSRLPMQESPDAEPASTIVTVPATEPGENVATVATGSYDVPFAAEGASAQASMTAAQNDLYRLADALLSADATDARAYRLNRMAAWMDFVQLPPDEGGQTRIAAPIQDVLDAGHRLRDGELDIELVRYCEAQLPAFPCWLDLQCWTAIALERLGERYAGAWRAVKAATHAWLTEFPGIVSERFANGMPFASEQTVQWLRSLAQSSGTPGAGDANAALTSSIQMGGGALGRARAMARDGELDGAIALLQKTINDATRADDRLRARIVLCELFCAYRPGPIWSTLAQGIIDDIDHHDLQAWDPSLALTGWTAAYAAFRQAEEEKEGEEAARLLARIARVDAMRALRLLSRP